MQDQARGLVAFLEAMVGAAGTTLLGAAFGRLTYHPGEVRARRRRFFGRELLWEIPVAVTMAIVGESLATYLGFSPPVSTGIVATLAYLGPRGAEALIEQLIKSKTPRS